MKTFVGILAVLGCAMAQAPAAPAPYGSSSAAASSTGPPPPPPATTPASSGYASSKPRPTGTYYKTVTTTIYCPTSTTFICQGTTYAVSTPTSITITCAGGCVTSAVPTAKPTPTMYQGAGSNVQVQQAGVLAAAALGLLAL